MTVRCAVMKTVPPMTTDAEAEAFLDQDLSTLDFTQFRPLTWFSLNKAFMPL